MAHRNIEQRREHVREALGSGSTLQPIQMKVIAERFGCTPSAIREDVFMHVRGRRGPTMYPSPILRKQVRERDRHTCQYCGAAGSMVEHVIPRPLGDAATYNLVCACQSCNTRKRSQVWIPRNLDEITEGNPKWRALVYLKARHEKENEG